MLLVIAWDWDNVAEGLFQEDSDLGKVPRMGFPPVSQAGQVQGSCKAWSSSVVPIQKARVSCHVVPSIPPSIIILV